LYKDLLFSTSHSPNLNEKSPSHFTKFIFDGSCSLDYFGFASFSQNLNKNQGIQKSV